MDPKEWGPITWRTMHAFAWEADRRNTEETKKAFIQFMHTLTDLLPCDICRQHMNDYIKDHPIPLINFFAYTVEFHNSVNNRLGKKMYSLEEATKIWTTVSCGSCSSETKETNSNNTIVYIFIGLILLSIICIYKWIYATR